MLLSKNKSYSLQVDRKEGPIYSSLLLSSTFVLHPKFILFMKFKCDGLINKRI